MPSPSFYTPANNVKTTVVGSYTALSRHLHVLDGSKILPTTGRPCRVTVVRQSDNAYVIYSVTSVVDMGSYYDLTVDPIEGTTDLNFLNNDRVEMRITAGALEDIHSAIGDLYTTISGSFGPQGTQGRQGTTGATGSTGLTGNQGSQGVQGSRGLQGFQGFQGSIGNQGFQGTTGAASTVAGPQGSLGLQGVIGNQGFQGNTGVQGYQGNTGFQGVAGTAGGPQGVSGVQGVQGYQGGAGIPGGPQGVQGVQGEVGFMGSLGPIGPQGVQGRQGFQGDFGVQGRQGIQGTFGVQGLQGYQGFQGNVGVGSQGVQGSQGRQGVSGSVGTMAIGSSVTDGTSGSVLFVGSGGNLSQDNDNFYWDQTQQQLSIGTNDLNGLVNLVNSRPNNACLTIQSASGQSADLFKIVNYNSTTTFYAMDSIGRVGFGSVPDVASRMSVLADSTYTGLRIRNLSNTKNPLEVQNSSNQNLVHVGSTGNLYVGSPSQGIAASMGTFHVSRNNNIGGLAYIVSQHNTASPLPSYSFFEARDTTGAVIGKWDYLGNMIFGLSSNLIHPGSRISALGADTVGLANLHMQANLGATSGNPFVIAYNSSGIEVFQINSTGDIVSSASGNRFGYKSSADGKIGFYNTTPIVRPESGTLLDAMKALGLVGPGVTL